MCVYECVHIHAVSVNAKGMPPPGAEVTDGGGLPKVGGCVLGIKLWSAEQL